MTEAEIAQATALARCKFTPGSTVKRFVAWAEGWAAHRAGVAYTMTPKASLFLDKLAHEYREQLGKCMSVACTTCTTFDPAEVAIAADAVSDGDHRFDDRIVAWRKAGLRLYNATHGTTFAHPYEYATKVAASNRRATTLGDVFCRFCGEPLFAQVKQPHKLVKESAAAGQHLTICALQVLAGLRAPAKPGHRAVPMEDLWR